MHDVARLAGVSHATVSNVLNNKHTIGVRPATRERVLAAARELNFYPNFIAQSLKKQKVGFISLVTEKALAPRAYLLALEGTRSASAEFGYHVVLCEGYQESDSVFDFIDMFQKNIICGVIFNCAPWMSQHPFFNDLMTYNVPNVIIGSVPPDLYELSKINFVRMDFYKDAYQATRYMTDRGIKGVCYFHYANPWPTEQDRLNGYLDACRQDGIEPRVFDFHEFEEAPVEFLERLLTIRSPTLGILTSWDAMCYRMIPHLQRMGVPIPERVSLVALDDINYTDCAYPRLTTINQPNEEAGRVATRILDSYLKDKRYQQVVIEGRLEVRESCI